MFCSQYSEIKLFPFLGFFWIIGFGTVLEWVKVDFLLRCHFMVLYGFSNNAVVLNLKVSEIPSLRNMYYLIPENLL